MVPFVCGGIGRFCVQKGFGVHEKKFALGRFELHTECAVIRGASCTNVCHSSAAVRQLRRTMTIRMILPDALRAWATWKAPFHFNPLENRSGCKQSRTAP